MNRLSKAVKAYWVDAVPYVMLVLLLVITAVLNPATLSMGWIANKLDSTLILILATIGQTIVLLTGGFDLSIGGVICVTNSFAAVYLGKTPGSAVLCCVLCIGIGILIGIFNGLAIVKTGMQPFIVTLATQSVCYGVALFILKVDGGNVPSFFYKTLVRRFGMIPLSLFILATLVVLWLWIRRTNLGMNLYALGSNENAARLSGVKVDRMKVLAYSASGLFGALAGLYRTAQVGSGSPTAGASYVMQSIAAAVVGGTALSGGKGGIIGGIIGAFILKSIADLLIFLQVSSYWTSLVQGILLILAVALNAYGTLRKQKEA